MGSKMEYRKKKVRKKKKDVRRAKRNPTRPTQHGTEVESYLPQPAIQSSNQYQ